MPEKHFFFPPKNPVPYHFCPVCAPVSLPALAPFLWVLEPSPQGGGGVVKPLGMSVDWWSLVCGRNDLPTILRKFPSEEPVRVFLIVVCLFLPFLSLVLVVSSHYQSSGIQTEIA